MNQNYPRKQSKKLTRQEKELRKASSIQKQRQKKSSAYRTYKIQFDKRALDFLNKLDHETEKRIWNKLQECKRNPFHYLKSLTQIKGYKLRVGDYRLIIDVQNKIKVLFVLKIDKRSRIYD